MSCPGFPKDTTDRNRTSPFAFTGNKFEFRMLGSAISIACPNIMLNTIVAEELRQFADELEGSTDLENDVRKIVQRVIKEHKRIIFNGNDYSDEWTEEAAKRGLLNLNTTVDALPRYLDQKNVELFTSHKIYTEAEMRSRYEIIMENYCKDAEHRSPDHERDGPSGHSPCGERLCAEPVPGCGFQAQRMPRSALHRRNHFDPEPVHFDGRSLPEGGNSGRCFG